MAHTAPSRLLILGLTADADKLHDLLSSSHVQSALPRRLLDPERSGVVLGLLGADGSVSGWNQLWDDLHDQRFDTLDEFTRWVLGEGMSQLLHDSDAVHRGSSSFHYRTPSGSHQEDFIVVGEAFHNTARAGFAAMATWHLLQGGTVREVLVDTSSLSAVGYALSHLAGRFSSIPPASVRSFRGHAAPKELIDRWCQVSGALFLISASASGKLTGSLNLSEIDGARAISLFFIGNGEPQGLTVCDLQAHENVGDGPDIKSIEAFHGTCPMCDQGSALLEITGDSLFPATPHTDARKIVIPDRPAWIPAVGGALFTRGFFELSAPVGNRKRTVHFNLSAALGDSQIQAEMKRTFTLAPGAAAPDLGRV